MISYIDFNKDICEFNLQVDGFKFPVPCIFLKATKQNIKKVVIYVHGLNGSKNSLQFLSKHLENAHIIGFDCAACGFNENPTTIHYQKQALDLKNIILTLKDNLRVFNLTEFYLTGESFGASICILFLKKYSELVNGSLIWNMPRKVIDVSKSSWIEKLKISFPIVWSLITNLPTYNYAPSSVDKLSNNKILIRISNIKNNSLKTDNRNIIAAWLGNYKAWRIMLSSKFVNNLNINLVYISSNDDLLKDHEAVDILNSNLNNLTPNNFIALHLKKGTHILLYDEIMGSFLLDAIDKFVLLDKNENLCDYKNELIEMENQYLKE